VQGSDVSIIICLIIYIDYNRIISCGLKFSAWLADVCGVGYIRDGLGRFHSIPESLLESEHVGASYQWDYHITHYYCLGNSRDQDGGVGIKWGISSYSNWTHHFLLYILCGCRRSVCSKPYQKA
jgi:hypothetical protein